MSQWWSLKQRANWKTSPSSSLSPFLSSPFCLSFSHLQYTFPSLCPFPTLSFLFLSSLFHRTLLPRWLDELNVAFHHSLFLPPLLLFTSPDSLHSILRSLSLFSRSFPPSFPHDLSLPPSHTLALPLFLCLLSVLPALCVFCVCTCVCDCVFPLTERDVSPLLSGVLAL